MAREKMAINIVVIGYVDTKKNTTQKLQKETAKVDFVSGEAL